ncbi:MAG: DUF3047 domain-containing protein [Candidatus Omnitrophota bacterium]
MRRLNMSREIKFKALLIISVLAPLFLFSHASAASAAKWFSFNKRDALAEWQEKIFKGKVFYSIKMEKMGGYLAAYSKNAASGILYEISFSPRKYPVVSWKWKVIQFPQESAGQHSAGRWIEKDDYATRFYVIFPAFFFTNTKSLEYVWDKYLPEGTVMTSPYYRNIKIIVAESGEKNLGKWVSEKRNIYEDFKKAFGRAPGHVGAIAIMTDTDNTISTAEADYDEIKVGYKDGEN